MQYSGQLHSRQLHIADILQLYEHYVTKLYKLTSVQRSLLTPDNGKAALHKRMPMYCDKPLTTDKRYGHMKRRHGCIVCAHVHWAGFMPR